MSKLNQILLAVLLVMLIAAIPYVLLLITHQHDAVMCSNIVDCHTAYKTYSAYSTCARPFRSMMIFKQKVDPAVIEKNFEADKSEKKSGLWR